MSRSVALQLSSTTVHPASKDEGATIICGGVNETQDSGLCVLARNSLIWLINIL